MRIIEGKNPVIEALRSEAEIDTILVSRDVTDGSLKRIIELAKQKNILVKNVDKATLDRLSENKRHQGVIAEAMEYEYKEIDYILNLAKEKGEKPFVIILDEITDVHNLGAIIRTAECMGAHGIIIPKRRAAQVNGVVAKSSAGAVEYLPIARVTNISNTIEELKQKGLWIYGAHMDGNNISDEKFDAPVGLVIGSEGFGIGRLVKEKCDTLVKIPMKGKVNSLNASCAASIIIYEIMKQRGF
ncbi:23S rRNA (guanosine(2251)-2'-O)-methyltransferase RlmB [Sedimentibacter hydroxybenzoicus DSM 7310]|uniref:23S rRNA (Guanosine(2251)-2'-O)-methyltransferase RlmB n=1 Tax=Sedimentibacter hydroxybenzoicus DSM 7310 TaxID=1123245 RepID=A0A974GWA2_SEDHY|nr:23S rRNA (guanosine(2251)-2'-O)-methyltransferase RlmB [Sedimentibacter hydroxybenzoicus]NYB74259.1 23S rRNA (guanosine(2251)-2'-O)-methyltransferase RlmB [Sedimentibacter hydroxybenzoicus DSM 7310]